MAARKRLSLGSVDVRKGRRRRTPLLLKWARANGCDWDEWSCLCAARSGHLEVLQMRANVCPWSDDVRNVAEMKGHHRRVMEWAVANGCP